MIVGQRRLAEPLMLSAAHETRQGRAKEGSVLIWLIAVIVLWEIQPELKWRLTHQIRDLDQFHTRAAVVNRRIYKNVPILRLGIKKHQKIARSDSVDLYRLQLRYSTHFYSGRYRGRYSRFALFPSWKDNIFRLPFLGLVKPKNDFCVDGRSLSGIFIFDDKPETQKSPFIIRLFEHSERLVTDESKESA